MEYKMTALKKQTTELPPFDDKKEMYVEWFQWLQNHICSVIEKIESDFDSSNNTPATFKQKIWQRETPTTPLGQGGGGIMRVMENGSVFEKAGVNFSKVMGNFDPNFAKEIPGTDQNASFWASGISLVIHPKNPFVPIVHMNTRHIETGRSWFGGGADLTPCFTFEEDTIEFHQAMKDACDPYSPNAYVEYKKWCDEYFYLPHRQEPRGVGGIFFDYVNSGNPDEDFNFLKAVGMKYIEVYEKIVRRRMHMSWTEEDKKVQLTKRGRYAEFNLLYDRGTRFGLMTNGNTEAILMSLPPQATWSVTL